MIPSYTNYTIGVVDISSLGLSAIDALIHRLELFSEITGIRRGESVEIDHIFAMIRHPKGIFAKAVGKRILYFNKIESEKEL